MGLTWIVLKGPPAAISFLNPRVLHSVTFMVQRPLVATRVNYIWCVSRRRIRAEQKASSSRLICDTGTDISSENTQSSPPSASWGMPIYGHWAVYLKA